MYIFRDCLANLLVFKGGKYYNSVIQEVFAEPETHNFVGAGVGGRAATI
jgi:hypothetical protein